MYCIYIFFICGKAFGILQAYLKNSAYDDSLNMFADTVEFFELLPNT